MKSRIISSALLCLSLCFMSVQLNAQDRPNEKRAQIEELRQKYISERLKLDAEEQKAFDQVQAEYQAKIRELRADHRESTKSMRQEMIDKPKEDRELTEEQARKLLMARIEREEAMTKLDKEYTEAMIQAISAKKTVDYKRLEREFKRELIHMVKDDRQRHHMREELRHRGTKEAESRPVEAK